MSSTRIRVRFAPSPTGFMHLGNVRAALINYFFARQKDGTFIVRVEDTDPKRNVDPHAEHILADLAWLGLGYDEGPIKEGSYGPYFQSQRTQEYAHALSYLQQKHLVYPCFCSAEELEKKRHRQLALKQPPRYDRACLGLSQDEVAARFEQDKPFIWRFKLDHNETVQFYDLAHKTMSLELKHFSDVPLTREDGSYTFLFANFLDDVAMKMTHVVRGEDHLTNTAAQVALYQAFEEEVPVFLHLPILCNIEGKKLSKRDFGFSLTDLQKEGFLPEALINYLGIIGRSVQQEVMTRDELVASYPFDKLSTTGQIKYDSEKLRWLNHQWIMRLPLNELVARSRPFIAAQHPQLGALPEDELGALLKPFHKELTTLKQSADLLGFLVSRPSIDQDLAAQYHLAKYREYLKAHSFDLAHTPEQGLAQLKKVSAQQKIPLKDLFTLVRIGLIGKAHGPSMHELLAMLPPQEIEERIQALVTHT